MKFYALTARFDSQSTVFYDLSQFICNLHKINYVKKETARVSLSCCVRLTWAEIRARLPGSILQKLPGSLLNNGGETETAYKFTIVAISRAASVERRQGRSLTFPFTASLVAIQVLACRREIRGWLGRSFMLTNRLNYFPSGHLHCGRVSDSAARH